MKICDLQKYKWQHFIQAPVMNKLNLAIEGGVIVQY